MRIEARIFMLVGVFLVLSAIGYGWWTWATEPHGLEAVGTTCILLSAGLCGIIGSYFAFVARRIDARPEDRPDADIAEGAGELGFFSPGSYWPIGLAASATITGLAVALAVYAGKIRRSFVCLMWTVSAGASLWASGRLACAVRRMSQTE